MARSGRTNPGGRGRQTFLATFLSGFAEVVSGFLQEDVADVRIERTQDTLVAFRTQEGIGRVLSLRYFNNTFLLFKTWNDARLRLPCRICVQDMASRRDRDVPSLREDVT